MRRKNVVVALATVMTLSMNMTSFAGQWLSDANGWWWQNDDGSYPVNQWQWIDGNGDSVAENYYFNENGYCLLDTTTPDGNTVNGSGAWVVNGLVQTQSVSSTNTSTNTETASVAITSLTPVQKQFGIENVVSIRDVFGNLHSNVAVQDCRRAWNDSMWSVYYNAANYTYLRADRVVLSATGDALAEEVTVEVYDATTDTLLDKISITPLDSAITLNTTISGHELIKINCYVSSKNGYGTNIIFKNLRFAK